MSKWDDFKKSVGIIADKTVSKTRELTDTASLKIKIATKEADRDAEYKTLGKLTYAKLKKLNIPDAESVTERISESIEKINTLNAEISALKAEEKARLERLANPTAEDLLKDIRDLLKSERQ